jgi:sigma-B regulation protein RsbU (phosphoserine phosphatase)
VTGQRPADAEDDRSLFEDAPCGYVCCRPNGTITRVNNTFLALTGLTRDELVNRRAFADLLTPGGRIYHETHYAPMLQMQGSAREIALEIMSADGRRLPVLVSSMVVRDDAGEPVSIRTAVFEATERRAYERELLRAKQRAEVSEQHARVLARTLQQTLIPPALPDIAGLDLAAAYRPAGSGEEVGGDFYDVFEIGPSDWFIAIGDVCGKGANAAVVTALVRHAIRGAAVRDPRPKEVLETLNAVLHHHHSDRFSTVALVRLRQAGTRWDASVASAGHPLPLLVERGREPREVGRYGTLLGVLDRVVIHADQIVLPPGSSLVLYTDGVTEGRRGQQLYGEDRLHDAVVRHAGSAAGLCEGVLAEVLEFQSGVPSDDIGIVVAHVPGGALVAEV